MSNQPNLFNEDIWEALCDCVRAMGGNKIVGSMLRPEMDAVDAGKWLSTCLNPSRAEKLGIEQVLWILREARKVNCHAGMAYIARDSGYADPVPVEPEDERAALQREFIEQSKSMQKLFAKMERAGLRSVA